MDIEESGRGRSSGGFDRGMFYAEDRSVHQETTRQLNRTDVGSGQDPVAIQAINRLGRTYVPLQSTRTTNETKLVLLQMRRTYAGIFNKPRQAFVLLACRYYLWRLNRR